MFEAPLLIIIGFALTFPWGGPLLSCLAQAGVCKHIRVDGPEAHQVKEGTLTMGGILVLIGASLLSAGLVALGYLKPLGVWVAMATYGALGAYDDWQGLSDREGVGWLARYKFPAQWVVSLLLALLGHFAFNLGQLGLTLGGRAVSLGFLAVPVSMFLLVAGANAVNISDGLDGLASGLAIIAYGVYGLLALRNGQIGLARLCFGLIGALLAFLWFNIHPARVFMGDVGSQALGAGLAAVALLSGCWLLLPVIGIVFVAEALSVILQVAYFKYTRRRYGKGRRIFRMAPLHHHLELGGWSEVQVTQRLWIVAALVASLVVAWGSA